MEELKILFHSKNRLKGITIIELLLTIALISLTGYLIIVKSSSISSKLEIKELNGLIKTINNVKTQSIISRESQSVILNFDDNSYSCNGTEQVYQLKYLKFDEIATNRKELIFTNTGKPGFNTAGTIILKGKNKNYKITVTPVTGKVNHEY